MSPHDELACTPDGPAPPQEKMPADRRAARQRAFRARQDAAQPTLRELLASTPPPARADGTVTAILNHYNRRTLCRQLDALRAQTVRLAHLWVCAFASPLAASIEAAALAYNDTRIAVFRSEVNFKYFGRFQLALSAPTDHVLVIDDDMLPGPRFVETLLHVASVTRGGNALLGSIGWLLPTPSAELTFPSYRALRGGGLYVPDAAYDLAVDRLLEVDYLCSLWSALKKPISNPLRAPTD